MSEFHFYHPIEVRYGDLDPQGHLNNAKYLTYMEQARIQYIYHLGLWQGGSFTDIGMILADVQVTFRQPIQFGQALRIGVRTTRMGNKSFNMAYRFEDAHTSTELASGSSVQVAYDYRASQTVALPDTWRQAMAAFEAIPFTPT